MLNNIINLSNFKFFTELFFIISGVLITIAYSVLKTRNSISFEIHKPLARCISLIFLMGSYLIVNEFNFIYLNNKSELNTIYNTISQDSLGIFIKFLICIFASAFFYIIVEFLDEQKVECEYLLILYFAMVGLILLCVCNDLMSSYLAIELVSVSSYLLASFKKESSYSVEAGLKYFVMGSISSVILLLNISLIYASNDTLFFNIDTKYYLFSNDNNIEYVSKQLEDFKNHINFLQQTILFLDNNFLKNYDPKNVTFEECNAAMTFLKYDERHDCAEFLTKGSSNHVLACSGLDKTQKFYYLNDPIMQNRSDCEFCKEISKIFLSKWDEQIEKNKAITEQIEMLELWMDQFSYYSLSEEQKKACDFLNLKALTELKKERIDELKKEIVDIPTHMYQQAKYYESLDCSKAISKN